MSWNLAHQWSTAPGTPSRLPRDFSTGIFKGGVRSCVLLVALLMQGGAETIQIIEVKGSNVIHKFPPLFSQLSRATAQHRTRSWIWPTSRWFSMNVKPELLEFLSCANALVCFFSQKLWKSQWKKDLWNVQLKSVEHPSSSSSKIHLCA